MIFENRTNDKPLYDYSHVYLPFINFYYLPDLTMMLIMIITTFGLLLSNKFSGFFLVLIPRLCMLHGTIFFLRALTITCNLDITNIVTILPNPFHVCKPKYNQNIYYTALLIIIGRDYTCHDLLFSGHSVVIMIYSLFYFRYTKSMFLKCSIIPLTLTGFFLILSTRFHYTSDVLFAILISFVGFFIYHSIIDEITETLSFNQLDFPGSRKNFLDVGIYNDSNWIKRTVVIFIVWHESIGHLVRRDGSI